jgi:hypothetical protein
MRLKRSVKGGLVLAAAAVRGFLALLLIALGAGPAPGQAGQDPLASLVEPNARLTIHYVKTVDTELITKGGKDGIGAVKNIDRVITEADGKVLLNLPKNRSRWSDYFPSPGPGGKPITVWFDPDLLLSNFTDPMNTFAREVRVSGKANNQRFSINTWGPPSPKWLHTSITHKAKAFNSDDLHDFYNLTVHLGEPKITPSRTGKDKTSFVFQEPDNFVHFQYIANFPTEDEVTEERFRPENARNTEVYSVDEVKKGSGVLEVILPRKDEELKEAKANGTSPEKLWDRVVELHTTGLTIKAHRGWTTVDPPREGVVRSVLRVVESLKVEFDQDMELDKKPPKKK